MSDYYVSKTALDAMPLTLPGEDISKIYSGSDPVPTVQAGLATEPQKNNTDWITKALEGALSNNLYEPLTLPDGTVIKENPNTKLGGVLRPDSTSITKPVIYAALFVVVGLLIISRGFGLLGEEGANIAVNLTNPEKFPGVGHAIQGIRKRKK